MPRAEDAGIRNVIIQSPWVSDAEDPKLIASLHAPRDLVVSRLWDGEEALGRLVDEVHRRGMKVILWYPGYKTYTEPPNPNPTQVQELERLREHEYLLYRMGAGTYIDMAVYHRALASGGVINIANFDEIDDLKGGKQWLKRINLEHRQVVDRMQRRKLLVSDDRWLGVAWPQDGSDEQVIFAFDQPFRYRPDGPTCVKDISEGGWSAIDGELVTQPWRTYLNTSIIGSSPVNFKSYASLSKAQFLQHRHGRRGHGAVDRGCRGLAGSAAPPAAQQGCGGSPLGQPGGVPVATGGRELPAPGLGCPGDALRRRRPRPVGERGHHSPPHLLPRKNG